MGPDTEKGADFLMRFLNAPRQLPWGRGSVNCHLFETDFMVKNGNVERDDSYSGINAIVFTDCISHTHITLLNPHSALTALRFIPLTCTRPPAGSYTGVYRGGGECGTVFFPLGMSKKQPTPHPRDQGDRSKEPFRKHGGSQEINTVLFGKCHAA